MRQQQYLKQMRWEGFRNDSASTVPPFGLVVVTGITMLGTTYKRPVLTCDQPSVTFKHVLACNGPTQVKAGKYGRCTRGPGPVWCAYDTGTPAFGQTWGPKPAQFTASSGFPRGLTVHGIVRAADKILLGTLHEITHAIGKTTGAITGGTSATTSYRFYSGVPFSGSDCGFTTVGNAYSKVDIATTKWIDLSLVNGYWLMQPLECNA